MKRGKFITFEGPDGSGKTTVSKAVIARLEEEGYPVRYTREPGGSGIAEQIRNVILDPNNTEMDARTEALLYAASRRQHLVEVIIPCLNQGTHVICDRFVDSSLAYQGCGRDLGIEEVFEINRFAIENQMPDKTIYLHIDAEEGLQRIQQGRSYLDRLDQEGVAFHQKVWNGYQEILKKDPERMIVIDAQRPVEEVIEEAFHTVRKLLDEESK